MRIKANVTPLQSRRTPFLALALSVALLGGCAKIVGSETVDTEPGADAEGHGPGLVSGKEGGIVFYNDVWWGNAPDGGGPD